MPRRAITHNRSDVRAQWKLLKDMGEEPGAVCFLADGMFRILTIKAAEHAFGSQPKTGDASYWDKVIDDGSA